MDYINVDGYDIAYRETGSGEKTAVILQGWGTSLSVYDSIADSLKDEYRVIQFDFPGFGDSTEPKEPWGVDDYADFFCSLMNEFCVKSTVLIGHSYGSRVIIKLASRSDLDFSISKIVLVDGAGVPPLRSKTQRLKIFGYKVLKLFLCNRVVHFLFPEVIDDWKSRQGSEDYRNASEVMKKCLVKAVNEDLTELLPKVKAETLLVWGNNDTATPTRDAWVMRYLIPNAGIVILENAGHFSFLDKPNEFKAVIQSFLMRRQDEVKI